MEPSDFRESAAWYYDLGPHHPDDVPFYLERIRWSEERILELGCGTGRVSLPLVEHCSFLHGVDHSDSMLAICEAKIRSAGWDENRIQLSLGDISAFDRGPKEMVESWASPDENLAWQVETDEGRVACFDRRVRVQVDPLVVYPELIYRPALRARGRVHEMIGLERHDAEEEDAYRREAHGMAEACAEAVLSVAGRDSVASIFVKGSAYRPWDSIIDYVPQFSDVDVHVRLTPDGDVRRSLRTLDQSISVARRSLRKFVERFPEPLHVPRPQILLVNDMERMPGYLPSPDGTLRTVWGPPNDGAAPADYVATQEADLERFRSDAIFVRDELPLKVIDRPGHLLWRAVSLLPWRVGPGVPRILTQLGADPFQTWSMNRTELVGELHDRGLSTVADAYVEFYLAGWAGFRTGFLDGGPAEEALRAAGRFFELGTEIVELA